MLTRWRDRLGLQRFVASQGKGLPIPYTGRNRYKPVSKWPDDDWGDATATYRWRAKNRARLNNRDLRRAAWR
jgi:hypothetical protein